jgi:hypothetical protein
MEVPLDIKVEWFKVIRRIQSVAKNNGMALIDIRVLVDCDGIPILWSDPKVSLMEPKAKTGFLASGD